MSEEKEEGPEKVGDVAARVLARFGRQAAAKPPEHGPRGQGVYAKLIAAQAAVEGVTRSGRNDHFNYRFVQEHEVLDVCKEALGAAGLAFHYDTLAIRDRVVETKSGNKETMTDLKLRLYLTDPEDGSQVSATFFGRGQDNMDKGTNKALVAGIKYGLLKLLMVSTGDDDSEQGKNDQRTGGGSAPRQEQAGQAFRCPECGSPMWDNRSDARSGAQGGKRPNFVCKADKKHVIWANHHPSEKPPEEAPPPAEPQGDEPQNLRAEELGKLTKAELYELFHGALPYAMHPLVFAYALTDPKVKDDPTRWTKDDYARAQLKAEQRGGVLPLVQAAAAHLAKAQPAEPTDLDVLNAALTTAQAAGMPETDVQWCIDAGQTMALPLVAHATTLAREFEENALVKKGSKKEPAKKAEPKKSGPDDDLPY